MIVDTSALIAILRDEDDAETYARALGGARAVRISAATYLETGIVIDQARDPVASRHVDDLLRAVGATVEAVTAEHARIAREAYRDFGRGSGHPAKLTYGDCFAYALARERNEALLFKGDGFIHTDVTSAVGS